MGERRPKPHPTGRANRLAVTALICAFALPVLAPVLGLVALDEIEESEGAERGEGMAKWAIGLGFVNVLASGALVIWLAVAL